MIDKSAIDNETARHGFFHGPIFLHPDLKFQYRFPEGWSTWNERDTVGGLSSVQDAMIKLRTRAGTPPKAAATFFGQPGLAAEGISDAVINGLPATTGAFVVDSGEAAVRGIATFIAFGGSTFEVVASATSDQFDSYLPALSRSITTFDRLNGVGAARAPAARRTPARPSGLVRIPPLGSIGTAPSLR
jgi:predicted Zn-dependent protease